ncbi:hypothetical protein B9Z55_003603 [Caenorhabditis nigoni]|uniref:Uncharacterized protein n=1 Tax=Caenorhabditis nigoni TaxID=1611254 RepID=A0A2G5VRA2_9PELO|nr:hypothetical protein B9Z55_003603 [Caenorhabditis nigoni]
MLIFPEKRTKLGLFSCTGASGATHRRRIPALYLDHIEKGIARKEARLRMSAVAVTSPPLSPLGNNRDKRVSFGDDHTFVYEKDDDATPLMPRQPFTELVCFGGNLKNFEKFEKSKKMEFFVNFQKSSITDKN